ncbi:uncharacterized protein NPIL_536801 [Nephila pilipes]|uniref:BPTI/Kunitz inhibitor domain-containing protein n=1 Tax=Nephila pilipes TaxID=299642 RepID=A0A8X6MVM5_NEPPI|nr:uncharacterized protein NPIL_536801 [Nephila pilipes]
MALIAVPFLSSTLLCTLILFDCSIFLSFSESNITYPKDNSSRILSTRSLLQTLIGMMEDFDPIQQENSSFIQQGIAVPFCNLFGCSTPANQKSKCSNGYQYDEDSKRCRKLLN